MPETRCITCGAVLRRSVASGLCPKCLLLRAIQPANPSSPAANESATGKALKRVGPYILLNEIARGGMGVVYRAHEPSLNRSVAIKLLHGGEWASAGVLERFRTEARAAATLVHPNIVPLYSFGEESGNWYIAMRWIEGGSLANWWTKSPTGQTTDPGKIHSASQTPPAKAAGIQNRNTTPPATDTVPNRTARESVSMVRKLARAVHHAHLRGILHRDLKPANVLVDPSGEPILTDFGLARITELDSRVTRSDASLGTPAYMAPEVALGGSNQATTLSDVYGLGAILYELLTGIPPYDGRTPLEVLRQVTESDPKRPSSIQRAIHPDLETICLKCLSREPSARYASCEALDEDLGRWMEGHPILARRAGAWETASKWIRRHPLTASLLGLLLVSLLVITVGSWNVSRHLRTLAEQQRLSLVRLNVEAANGFVTANDSAKSLAYQIAAIRADAKIPEREDMHRIRLGLTIRAMPKLEHSWCHDAAASTAAFSRDGRRIVSAGEDGTARIWNTADGSSGWILRHPAPVIQAVFSADGGHILTLCDDSRARCWDAESGQLNFPEKPVQKLYYKMPLAPPAAFDPEGKRLCIAHGQEVSLFEVTSGTPVFRPLHLGGFVLHAAFSPDGQRLLTTEDEGVVRTWDLDADGILPRARYVHQSGAVSAAFSYDGRKVVSVGKNSKAVVWDAETGNVLVAGVGHDTPLRMAQATFSPANNHFLSVSFENTVRVWDGSGGSLLSRGIRHPGGIATAKWDGSGNRIVTASFDGTTMVWNSLTGESLGSLIRHGRYVVDSEFSPDGSQVVTACLDGSVDLWELAKSPMLRAAPAVQKPTVAIHNRQGTQVAVADANGRVQRADASTGDAVGPEIRVSGPVVGMRFSPSGRLLVCATADHRLHLLDLARGKEIAAPQEFRGDIKHWIFDNQERWLSVTTAVNNESTCSVWTIPGFERAWVQHQTWPDYVQSAFFAPDGSRLVTVAPLGNVRTWDVATGQEMGRPIRNHEENSGAQYSPDGRWLLVTTSTRGFVPAQASLWSTQDFSRVGAPLIHEDGVTHGIFSPDGRLVATGGEDATARLWWVPSGLPAAPLLRHENKVNHLAFSHDGRILATGTDRGMVRLWDIQTGNPLMGAMQIPGGIVSLKFREDRPDFLVVSPDATIHRWDISPEERGLPEMERMAHRYAGGAARQ